jgi:arylsulfatase A-like enzyme
MDRTLTRRSFLKSVALGVGVLSRPGLLGADNVGGDRPNILWLVSEDNSPFLGCYGDNFATTPNLDKLASKGVLYTNAFANAPVCAANRSTLINGMYSCSTGTHHMRSVNPIPDYMKFYSSYLRKAGYYCCNNAKTDYNQPMQKDGWDVSGNQAHYTNREDKSKPFFQIYNIGISHEGRIHKRASELQHDPDKVTLPPYHPDTKELREDWAQYYDRIQQMDTQVGKYLDELDKSGEADNTIVFYYSDHGGVVARSKRFLYDSGTHVPFIIQFPEKYQHLSPAAPGTKLHHLISFVDFGPTLLSLVGIAVPDHMQGEAFLGKQAQSPREYVYLYRGRMDERYDMVRGVRDKRFKYLRCFMPHRPDGQHLSYLWRAAGTRSWESAYKMGKCNEFQRQFFERRPSEMLFDTQADPYEVNNLAADPEYQDILKSMRQILFQQMRDIRDTGIMPEPMMIERITNTTRFEFFHSDEFDYDRVLQVADMVTMGDESNLPEMISLLGDNEEAVRYWAVIGFVILGDRAKGALSQLQKALNDPAAVVRIAAAEAVHNLGQTEEALPVLKNALDGDTFAAVYALNVLDFMDEKIQPLSDVLRNKVASDWKEGGYESRLAEHLISKISKFE